MRKWRVGYLAIAAVVSTNLAEATYIIKLKNGNEYITNRYWQEGAQIFFDAEGGVFGIDKVSVKNIEKTDKIIKSIRHTNLDPTDTPQINTKEDDNRTKDSAPADKTTLPAKNETDTIYSEFNLLKAQSANLSIMSRDELGDYANKLVRLISTIQNERKTNQYRQEYSELNALANNVEEAIKSRR